MDLVINNTNYSIPTSWSQVSLGKYMDFMLDIEGVEDELEKTIATISAFTNAPKKLLQGCKKSDIDAVMEELGKLMEEEANKDLNLVITIDGIDYGFHPNLHELKLKEFVDLDNKLGEGWSAMDSVMAILYRPIIEEKGDKYKVEEYDFRSAKKRAKIFRDNLSVNTVNGAASFFDYRNGLHSHYASLFKEPVEEREAQTFKTEEEQFNEKYGWYSLVYNLANGDILKFDEVLELSVNQCFNFLAYQKDLTHIQSKR